jgi:DNA-binding MarR family transcriptional regulator
MMDSAEVSTLCLARLPAHPSCSKLDAALADFELSPFRGVALSVLAHNENLSPLRLSRRFHVTPQAMDELIPILEQRGLIEGHQDSVNKKALLLRLTERGRLLWTEAKAIAKIIEQTIFRGLSKAELKTSRSILSNAIAARREQPVDKRESSS